MGQQRGENGCTADCRRSACPPDVKAILRGSLTGVIVPLAFGRKRSTGQTRFQKGRLGSGHLTIHDTASFLRECRVMLITSFVVPLSSSKSEGPVGGERRRLGFLGS